MITEEERQEAQEKLGEFIDECVEILESMLNGLFSRFIIEEMQEPLQEAWEELMEDNETMIDTIKNAINNLDELSLERHGLYGKQLKAKLILFHYLKGEYKMSFQKQHFHIPLKKLVDVMNSLLGSICDAIGIGGSLKEMKDIIYGAMNVP
jgi:hypothetical protein